jgi:hypothetical protein
LSTDIIAWKARYRHEWLTHGLFASTGGHCLSFRHARVLLALRTYKPKASQPAKPTQAMLAEVAGCSAHTVFRALTVFKARGL